MSREISDNTNFRLEDIRVIAGLKKIEFSKLLEIQPSTYSEIVHVGRTNRLPNKALVILNQNFNINLNWYFTGEGDMFLEKEKMNVSGKS